jgi:SAM-dependent methyltransferase
MRRDFPHLELLGADPLIDEYQKLYAFDPSITWQRKYLESLNLPDGYFDVVCCTNTLDHVEDVQAAMREIRRVMAPQGHLLLTVDVFAREKQRNEGHPFSFTMLSLIDLLRSDGLEVVWKRLNRRKLGVMNYANCRLGRGMSRTAVFVRKGVRAELRSYAKQFMGQGALGEMVLIARPS